MLFRSVFQNNLVCKSCSNLTPLDGATIGFTVPFVGANYTIQEDLAKIDNNSYQNSTYETQLNKFQLNLTVPTGTTIYNSVFDYNGTNYTGAETYRNGDFYSLTQEIDAPTINSSQENVTLRWFFTYVDSFGNHYVQSTTEENQTIKEIFFGLCNSTYPVQTLDFTLKQETGTQSPITVGTNFQASFKYWLGSGKINKTYEINKLNQATSTFNFCIDQNLTFQTNMGAEYSASGFVSRRDYLNNVSLTNSTTKVNLYLLNESKAVKFFLSVLNGYAGLPDIFVTIDKYEIGSNNWITVGRRKTDSLGDFIEYLDLDQKYRYSFSDGTKSYGVIEKNAQCSTAPCELILQLQSSNADIWNSFNDTYANQISYTLNFNKIGRAHV